MRSETPPYGLPSGSDSTDRGQTLQDFLFGISLFLVTVTLVFGLFPSFLTPFSSGIGAAEKATADRVSRSMVVNLSVTGDQNRLNETRLKRVLKKDQAALRERYGLPETTSINISVRTQNGEEIVKYDGMLLATSTPANNQSVASSTRVITIADRSRDVCQPACRLVINVW